jgi:hypothetical protein
MSFLTAAVIVGGSALVSGYMGSKAAKDAAGQTRAGIDAATAEQRRQYDVTREDYAPYREIGTTALKDITERMPFFTSQFGDEQMAQYLDPSMEFRRKIGEQTTARALNVGGGFLSGNTLRGLTDYGQGLASTEYGNSFNRFQTDRGNIYNTLGNIAGYRHGRNKPRRSIWSGCGSKHWNAGRRRCASTGFRNDWAGSSMAKFFGSGK